MDILTLLSAAAFTSAAVVTPLPSDYAEPMPPSVSFGMMDVNFTMPVTPTGIIIETSPIPLTPTTTPVPTSNPTPTPTLVITPSIQRTLTKNAVTIAFLGDSMTDTLGPKITELTDELKKTYPTVSPTIYNYGVGGTNIDYGIQRITHDYEYLGQKIPSLASVHPDIVVLESFAYNPYSYDTGAVDKHWMQLAAAVDLLKQSLPNVKIVIAATIAPNAATFGDGKLAFRADEKQRKVTIIKQYLESTISFAKGEHIPLADAYHPTLLADGNGDPKYINQGDHIHPSDEGRKFFSQIVAQTIINAQYLQ